MNGTSDPARPHILLVDDDEGVLTAGRLLLERSWERVSTCSHPRELPAPDGEPRVVLLDMNFGPGETDGEEGLAWLERILSAAPDTVVIMVTAHGDLSTAVAAMKRGATDFVTKPWRNEKLQATVSSGATLAATRAEARRLRDSNASLSEESARAEQPIIGSSPAMREVLALVRRAAPADANVLILGENGTGKDLVARAIHRASSRSEAAFLAVDLGAVPESLFESELFGHRKGAFTDARSDRMGRLVAASGGTLFLDEIGNVPLHLQAKLLGALETRRVTPLGGASDQPFDVRLISATNLPPERLGDPEVFRADLLFRLNTVEIHLPPLRDRREDIPALVRHYLPWYEKRYGKPHRGVPAAVLEELAQHDWPGNVRALRHAVERAVILAGEERGSYEAGDFSLPATARAAGTASTEAAVESGLTLEELERRAVTAALKSHGFNISRAARALGLTRAALYRRMEKFDL